MVAKKKKKLKVSKTAVPKKKTVGEKTSPKKVDIHAESAKRVRRKTTKTRDDLLKEHHSLVEIIAANITRGGKLPPGMVFDDLVSFGIEGLLKAWENFEESRGVEFGVYASYRIRGEILDRIRKEWRYRNPGSYKTYQNLLQLRVAEVAEETLEKTDQKKLTPEEEAARLRAMMANSAMVYLLSVDDNQMQLQMAGDQNPDKQVIENIEFERERRVLWEEIGTLPDDERRLIHLFYVENKTQKEISDILGYSKSKISRIHMQVLHKLRLRLNRKL